MFKNIYIFSIFLIVSLFIFAACSSDDDETVATFNVNAASGTDANLAGTSWEEPCSEQDGEYATASMTFTATGISRTETQYSDTTCATSTGSDTRVLTITNDGDKTGVTWGGVTPPSTSDSVTATKVTISGTEPDGTAFTFKTLFFVNDNATPNQLLFGNEDGAAPDPVAVLDDNDYPTTMWTEGASKDGTTTIDISSGSNGNSTTDIAGATWSETCSDRGNGEWVTSSTTFTSFTEGTRSETWYSDAACTSLDYSMSMILNLTTYGDQTSVTWVGGATPNGLDASVTATKVVIIANTGGGSESMRTLLYVNDQVTPNQLFFGDDDDSDPQNPPVLDSKGFPKTLYAGGLDKG